MQVRMKSDINYRNNEFKIIFSLFFFLSKISHLILSAHFHNFLRLLVTFIWREQCLKILI